MPKTPNILFRKIKFRRRRNADFTAFDPLYYVKRYNDLSHFDSAGEARRHYDQHGRNEGRYPNARIEEESEYEKYLTKSTEFDLRAYKALNPDLMSAFTTDKDFIIHYIRHGRAENRPTTFTHGFDEDAPLWIKRFSVSQFSSWMSGQLPAANSADEAIAQFEQHGIEQLAPIRFDHSFDPDFYRRHYEIADDVTDVDLYRRWLTEGLPQGLYSSEAMLLRPYIGEAAFPALFNWSAYARSRSLAPNVTRGKALIHLFERERKWADALNYLEVVDVDFLTSLVQFRLRRCGPRDADQLLGTYRHRIADWPAKLWLLWGDAHKAMGQRSAARDAYEKALAEGETSLRAVSEAVRANIDTSDFDRAFELIEQQRDHWLHKPEFELLIGHLIDKKFEDASAKAHAALAAIGKRNDERHVISEVNARMREALDFTARAVENLEMAPAKIGATPGGHIAMLSNEDLRQCTHYRVDQKQEQLTEAGFEVRRHPMQHTDRFLSNLIGASAAIFYRLPATPNLIRAILTARQMGIPTYYDIDDLIFCPDLYPAPYETFQGDISLAEYRGLQFGVPLFAYAMSLCDRAIASTPALLNKMKPIVREHTGFLLPNGLDSRNTAMIALGSKPRSQTNGRTRIFYGSGTLAHNIDFSNLVAPALAQLMDENGAVDLVLVGHVPYDVGLGRHGARVMRYPIISNIEEYWAVLSACDINLAVLIPDDVTDCKSEIKWLEAAILRIPTVASGTAIYKHVIESGVDGMIADSPEQWYVALTRLCADGELRRRIGNAAREKALAKYSLQHGAAILRHEMAAPAACSEAPAIRVLVCNVFFSPQSIGGATRVVENNISSIAAENGDIALAVFCTDEGNATPGRLRTSDFGGVPVFRLAVADKPDRDKAPFAPENAAAFREVVGQFKPDLVHFHCIQRLTGTVVRECLEMGIPYIVTVHDAWWISPYQFLVDENGMLRLPNADLLDGFARDPNLTDQQLRRRRQLEALLTGAECVIGVSESFAEIYRNAGIASTIAIPNGVPDLPAPLAPDRHDGKLRLALIGGRSSHKGADLVEAAIRRGDYPNLHLLMIDGWLAPGEKMETRWGSTPVTISAPFAQNDVAALYGTIDVLLAPSRWPESFGLVAREAAHFGLWVVASQLGAMGDDIIEGENGFRIDPSDRDDIDRILRLLNGAPDNYRQGTARRVGEQRHARAQARELADLYRKLLKHSERISQDGETEARS